MDVGEEFNAVDFEQRLTNLKDTQDSIQAMSSWCLKHRPNHKKVVSSWLNVLKQVKVEHRLILFYLANDVIQYSKRKNYEFVDSWGTTLQRATTMVRDEKVKHKIIRIFNIWEQRGIYNDEFLADLHDLLSINPTKKQQPVESDDEQVTIMSTNIRNCVRLQEETDRTFRQLVKTPLCDTENIHSLKDRRHVEDVEREIMDHMHKLENYIKSLNTEIKSRTIMIAVLEQTDAFYHNQRGEVKVVANAYRNFGNRIKTMKRKLDELCTALPSPIPSPDINAPSPEPDNDFDLPDFGKGFDASFLKKSNGFLGGGNLPFDINDFKSESPKSDGQPIQVIGSSSLSKDLTDFNIDEFFKSIMPETSSTTSSYTPNQPQPVPPVSDYQSIYADLQPSTYLPPTEAYHPPPPPQQQQQNAYRPAPPMNMYNSGGGGMPPQPRLPNTNQYIRAPPNPAFNQPYNTAMHAYHPPRSRFPNNNNNNPNNFTNHMPLAPPPLPPAFDGNLSDEYNPESWDLDMGWNSSQDDSFNHTIETPVSPPHFEREGINTNIIEYIEPNVDDLIGGGAADVDHRQLRLPKMPMSVLNKDKGRNVDVDHRNLISLTGSPGQKGDAPKLPLLKLPNMWQGDTDFRQTPTIPVLTRVSTTDNTSFGSVDADYRVTPSQQTGYNNKLVHNFNIKTATLLQNAKATPTIPDIAIPEEATSKPPVPPLEPPQLSKVNELLEIQKHILEHCSTSPPTQLISTPLSSPPKLPELLSTSPSSFLEPSSPLIKQAAKRATGAHPKSVTKGQNARDNVESIDMEMSDDDFDLPDFNEAYEEEEVTDVVIATNQNEASNVTTDKVNEPSASDQDTENKTDHTKDRADGTQKSIDALPPLPRPMFDQQFAARPPMQMFNTPPPNFTPQSSQQRPLLMTPPNFPPNRFWGNVGNMPPPTPPSQRIWGTDSMNNMHFGQQQQQRPNVMSMPPHIQGGPPPSQHNMHHHGQGMPMSRGGPMNQIRGGPMNNMMRHQPGQQMRGQGPMRGGMYGSPQMSQMRGQAPSPQPRSQPPPLMEFQLSKPMDLEEEDKLPRKFDEAQSDEKDAPDCEGEDEGEGGNDDADVDDEDGDNDKGEDDDGVNDENDNIEDDNDEGEGDDENITADDSVMSDNEEAKESPTNNQSTSSANQIKTPSAGNKPNTLNTPRPTGVTPTTTPRRPNPFSQPPRFPVNETDFTPPSQKQPRGQWQQNTRQDNTPAGQNQFQQNPHMTGVGFNHMPGGAGGVQRPILALGGGPSPMFRQQMMQGGGRGRGGGGGPNSPYFRPPRGGMGNGAGAGGGMPRPNFRNNFRGNNRGGNW